MRNPSCRSKNLPLTHPTIGLPDATQDMPVDSSLKEQVGGGRRPPSPPMETPTRLRTRIKPSERARDVPFLQQAGLRRALMGEDIGGSLSRPSVSLATDEVNTASSSVVAPSSAIFLGPPPLNSRRSSPASHALTLGGPVTVPPNDPATCSDSVPTVPVTHVIPPTPVPEQHATGNALSSSLTNIDPSTPTSGRRTAATNAILVAGYDELEAALFRLVEQTNLTVQQILDGWHKSRSRAVSGINHWNQYTKYAMRHEEQERQRLGLPTNVPLSPSVRRELYAKFKVDNPDTWQDILEVHDMIDNLQCSPQTIAQHAQTFNKVKKRVISLLESESAKYAFEAAIVMCGSVVNEDASLGFTHTTGGATTFFETRCRANSNMIIGHLKSHVYNHVSLETVKDTFGDKRHPLKEESANQSPAPAPLDGGEEHDDIMANIKDGLVALLQSVGGDVSKFKRSTFPWTTLLSVLVAQGLVIKGWPDGVLMPGQLRHPGVRTKGIADLNNAERRRLQQALLAGQLTIEKLFKRDERRAILEFNAPVVIGAPPSHESTHAKAQQMYGNSTFDFGGPERLLLPPMAVTRIKQKRVPKATYSDPIVISGGSSDDGIPHVIPAKNKGKKKAVVALDLSDEVEIAVGDKHSLSVNENLDDSEEDYQVAVESRKRKAKKPLVPGPFNKPVHIIDPKKGGERKKLSKGAKKFKSIEYVEVSDSSADETVKAPSVVVSKVTPANEEDLFNSAATIHGTGIFVPSTVKGADDVERLVEPSSPSPKRQVPLVPELTTSRKSPGNGAIPSTVATPPLPLPGNIGAVPIAPSVAPSMQEVVLEPKAVVPLGEATVPRASAPAEMPTMGAVTDTAFSLASYTTLPSTTVTPPLPTQNSSNVCDEWSAHSEWTRQAGSGYPLHAFHPSQPLRIPYHENNRGLVVPTQMQRGAMYPSAGAYREDLYRSDSRGDPRGPYGGFYPHVNDPFFGVWPSPSPFPGPNRRSSVGLSDTQCALGLRPSPHPVPGPSRHPSVHPPQVLYPCIEESQ